jgi:protocatechuate 3,4-dioxygenase beta subunit
MARSQRRDFLLALPALVCTVFGARLAGQSGLDQFGAAAPPCGPAGTPTPAVADDGTFRAGSPERSALAAAGLPGSRVTLTGTVSGVTCGRIKDAVVDVWQADSRGVINLRDFQLRGRQRTDADGRYRFETILPGANPPHAPHFGVRVRPPGKPDFWTEIFLPDGRENARDPHFTPALMARRTLAESGPTLVFDIVLDL